MTALRLQLAAASADLVGETMAAFKQHNAGPLSPTQFEALRLRLREPIMDLHARLEATGLSAKQATDLVMVEMDKRRVR